MAREKRMTPITFEGSRIMFRNFRGEGGQYNREGDRNFALVLDPEIGEAMLADGWNVKHKEARSAEEDDLWFISVKVKYTETSKPRVVLIGSRGQTPLDEDLIDMVDMVNIHDVDLIIRPYQWEVNGNTGVTAYLQTLYVKVNEDALQLKYADVPVVGEDNGQLELEDGSIVDAEVVEDEPLALEGSRDVKFQ